MTPRSSCPCPRACGDPSPFPHPHVILPSQLSSWGRESIISPDISPLPPFLLPCYPPSMKNFLPPTRHSLPPPLFSRMRESTTPSPAIRTPDFFQTNPTPETIALRHGFDIQIESCSRLIA